MDMQQKTRFKMYKSGKQWLFAGMTAVAMLGGSAVMADSASADTTDAATTAAATTTTSDAVATGSVAMESAVSSAATKTTTSDVTDIKDLDNKAQNYQTYTPTDGVSDPHKVEFSDAAAAGDYYTYTSTTGSGASAGSAATGVASDGSVNLTAGEKQAGAYIFNNQLDMGENWSMSVEFDVGSLPSGRQNSIGDFLGLAITPTQPNSVASAAQNGTLGGGALGIAGTKNAYVWGFDYWMNNESAINDVAYPAFGDVQVGLRQTDGSGNLVAGSSTPDASGSAAGVGYVTEAYGSMPLMSTLGTIASDGSFSGNATFAWDAATKTLKVTMGSYSKSFTLTNAQDRMSVGMLAVTGGAYTSNSVKITAMDAKLAVITNNTISYVDQDGNDLMPSTSFVANLGDTLKITSDAAGITRESTTVTAEYPQFEGYELTGVALGSGTPGKPTGSIISLTGNANIKLVYTRLAVATANYLTQDGTSLSDSVTVYGKATESIQTALGDAAAPATLTVDGKTYKLVITMPAATFDADNATNQVLNYYYVLDRSDEMSDPAVSEAWDNLQKVLADPNATQEDILAAMKAYEEAKTPAAVETPAETPATPKADAPVSQATVAPVVSGTQLPNTAVRSQNWVALAGLALLAGTALYVTRRKRS
jgi:LPXTG-motif cell wall-anchored protein